MRLVAYTSLVAAVGLLLAACPAAPAQEEAGPRTVRVECEAVEELATRDEITLRGTLEPPPEDDVKIAAQVAGAIRSVDVREGDHVVLGQPIARIDDAALADAERQAQAALAAATAEKRSAQTSLARSEQAFKTGGAPRQEVDDAVARVASAKAAEDVARAALDIARRDRGRTLLTSTIAGVVLRVFQRQGELVDGTPAMPIVEIADTSRLEVVVDASASDLIRLARDQHARIAFPGSDVTYGGTVSSVSPAVDRATGFGTLRIALGAPEAGQSHAPPIGSYASVTIGVGAERLGTFIPAAALRAPLDGRCEVVVCGVDHVAHVRVVELGGARAHRVEVRGALKAGDRVVVEPLLGVADGDLVDEAAEPPKAPGE